EFADAMRARGLQAGFYYSLLDWQHPDAYEMALPAYPKDGHARDHQRYKAYMRGHVRELLSNYGPLSTIWFDYSDQSRQGDAWGAAQLLSDMRDAQPSILVNNRLFFGLENKNGDYGTPEKYVPPTGLPGMDWEVNHTLNESYGYSAHDMHWKDVPTVVRLLADIVSKGGNLLLNIGPDAKGRVPEQAAATLRGVGAWMKVHGEAIYGTTASPFQRLAWGRATRKGNTLYLFVFDWPSDGMLHVPITNAATRATLLGASQELTMARFVDLDELVITLPKSTVGETLPVVRLELSDAPKVAEFAVRPDTDGVIRLKPHDAELHNEGDGEGLRVEQVGAIEDVQYNIGYWLDRVDFPSWKVRIPSTTTANSGKDAVRYEAYITMACADESAGSAYSLVLDGVKVDGVTRGTGGWQKYQDVFLGPVTWTPGAHSVAVKAITKPSEAVMNIREIRLVPVAK
ncbi:MAG: alpha-L-fucosidase, partial [Limnohabitans sp.]|nr:alpha-L-fucosidase [Limnohabitans sp.]